MTSGFTAVYFFLYSIYYFATKLEISDGTSTFLYFGYTVMLTFILFLFTGKLNHQWIIENDVILYLKAPLAFSLVSGLFA